MGEDSEATVENESDEGQQRSRLAFPTWTICDAVDLVRVINDQFGGSLSSIEALENAIGVHGGALSGRIAAAKRFNLLGVSGKQIHLTKLAIKILKPVSAEEATEAKCEAVLGVPLFKEVYTRFGTNFPPKNIFGNILEREYNVPPKSVGRAIHVIVKSLNELGPDALKKLENTRNAVDMKVESTMIPEQREGVLTLTFGKHVHSFPVVEGMSWTTIKTVINALLESWEKECTK